MAGAPIETKLLLVGTIGAIVSGIISFIMPSYLETVRDTLFNAIQGASVPEDVARAAANAAQMLSILYIIVGIFIFLFAIGLIGGGRLFKKGSGTAAGVFGLLAGLGAIIGGAGLIAFADVLRRYAEGAAISIEELGRSALMAGAGFFVYGGCSFLFSLLALIYFFGSPSGWLGGIGGLLIFISAITSILIPSLQYLTGVGMILMGIALFLQSKAAPAPPPVMAPPSPPPPPPPPPPT